MAGIGLAPRFARRGQAAGSLAVLLLLRTSAELPPQLYGLDCDRSNQFRAWRTMVEWEGPTDENVVGVAFELWRTTDWDNVAPRFPDGEDAEEQQKAAQRLEEGLRSEGFRMDGEMRWRSRLDAESGMSRYMSWVLPIFAALLHGGAVAERWLRELRLKYSIEDSEQCLFEVSPYAFLMLQYVLIYAFKRTGNHAMVDDFMSQLTACTEMLLDLPFHTYDFLDLAWNVSSFTLAVNLMDESTHYDSFEDYARHHPLPAPYLPPWTFDVPADSSMGSPQAQRRLAEAVRRFARPVRVGMLHLHDATAWDDWHSLRTAWASLLGGVSFGSDATASSTAPELQPLFYFTRLAGLRGCVEEQQIKAGLRAPFQALKDLLNLAREEGRGLEIARDFLLHWWVAGEPALRDAEILFCGEPVWLCPLLDVIAERPMLMRFNMAILDEFTYSNGKVGPVLDEWWAEFRGFVERGRAVSSVGTRYTVEQVAYQTGGAVRFPYVPFLGLSMEPRPSLPARPRGETLLFQSNLPPMLAFKRVLKMVVAAAAEAADEEDGPPALSMVDMNDLPRGVCRPEMGAFEAAVLLPHNPAPIRLIDLYAQGLILYAPAEPLIHKWIWANRPFGGFSGMPALRSMPSLTFRNTSSVIPPSQHPPFSGTAYVANWAISKHIADRRYWLQYTEWELLPGLQRFRGIPELIQQLRGRRPEDVEAIRSVMSLHLQARRADALAWWRAALAEAAVLPEERAGGPGSPDGSGG